MAKNFALDDLVWAKMKGFPPWPAKISQPPDGSTAKSKKPQHFVYFFGTHDVAWILDELIFPHSEQMLINSSNYKKKSTTLQAAIDEIKEESLKVPPKPKKSTTEKGKKETKKGKKEADKGKKEADKGKKEAEKGKKETPRNMSPELEITTAALKTDKIETPPNKSPLLETTPGTSKTPKKSLPKNKIEKKKPKKRPVPEEDHVSNSSKEEDYSVLVANVPPNNAHMAAPTFTYEGQVALSAKCEPFALTSALEQPKRKRSLSPIKKKLGFIGLGIMGSQMVRLLIKSKHNVTIWNRSASKCAEFVELGAQVAESPADLVRACDIIFCCVSDSEAVKAVFFLKGGVMEGFSGGGSSKDIGNKGYVEMTSIDPTTSQEISEAICGEGGRYLEAPMIGSREQLVGGSIMIVGSGDRSLFIECDTMFNAWARDAFYFNSDVGSASKMNLLVSMVLGTTYAAVAEALALVERCNIPTARFMNALEDGPLNCPLVMGKGRAMLNNDAVVEQPVKHLQKDLDMAVSLSNNYDQPLVLTVAVNETFKRAKREFSEMDVSAVHKCYKFDY